MRQENWDDLRVFLALYKHGNVRSAAMALGVGHSTVARRIDQLEIRTGMKLFDRRKGGPRLTPAGQEFLIAAERIEEEVYALNRRTFGEEHVLEGILTLTMIDAFAIPPLMEIFAAFRKTYPAIELNIHIDLGVAKLDHREADLALRFGEQPGDSLIGRRLMQTGRAVYASKDYVERHWPEPRETGAGWIGFTPPNTVESWKANTPFPDLPTHCRIEDMRAQVIACHSGLGIAYLPCFLGENDHQLTRLSQVDFPTFQTLWLVRHEEMRSHSRVSVLANFLAEKLKELSPLFRGEVTKSP